MYFGSTSDWGVALAAWCSVLGFLALCGMLGWLIWFLIKAAIAYVA